MKLSAFTNIIEMTFTDTVNVYRYEPVLNDDRTTDTELNPRSISIEPCRLSFATMENPRDTEVDSVPVITTPKLFFKVDSKLITGDYVEVTRLSEEGKTLIVYKGHIGLPAVFVTHREALFVDSGVA